MNIFRKIILSKEQKKKSYEIMLDYLEGRISVEKFWDIYINNTFMQNIIIRDKKRPAYESNIYYAAERLKNVFNINELESRAEFYNIIKRHFNRHKIKFISRNSDVELYNFLYEMQPKYINITDEKFLLEIYNSTPVNLIKSEKQKWCKEKLKQMFKFVNKPPMWIQSPEWPLVNGIPLIFKYQTKKNLMDEKVVYYFYNPENNEEIEVEQFY